METQRLESNLNCKAPTSKNMLSRVVLVLMLNSGLPPPLKISKLTLKLP